MPKSAADFEREFLAGLKSSSGKPLKSWMDLARESGCEKHNAVLGFFKKEHGFNHMQANFLAAIFRNGGKPVYGDPAGLLDGHFKGREDLRPLYEALAKKIASSVGTVEIVPTRGYVSFRRPREFAVARVTPKAIRVGMDLGERAFDSRVQKSKSLGAMPRISHMVEVVRAKDIDQPLVSLLKEADARVNGSS